MTRIVPIVLAAGRGRRLGADVAKACHAFEGDTFLGRILSTCAACDPLARPIVVLGAMADTVRQTHAMHAPRWVCNDEWASSQMFDSIVLGLEAACAQSRPDAVLIWPVDCPLVAVATIARLTQVVRGDAVVPVYDGHRGHPIRLNRPALDDVIQRRGAHLRALLEHWTVTEIRVDDAAVRDNLNTPAAVEAARARRR